MRRFLEIVKTVVVNTARFIGLQILFYFICLILATVGAGSDGTPTVVFGAAGLLLFIFDLIVVPQIIADEYRNWKVRRRERVGA